jgi:hypothetical protein
LVVSDALRAIHTHRWDFWLARASVAFIVVLQLSMINRLAIGPRWLAPVIELALLVPLSAVTGWTQISVRNAKEDHHWRRIARLHRWIRNSALLLTALISVVNLAALIKLLRALLGHTGHETGQTLLLDAVNIWLTNVIVFALWFWNIDRGGPAGRDIKSPDTYDFLFPQMSWRGLARRPAWSPGFIDYIYVSFTNAAAFSPTDTLPLSRRAKLLMMVQSAISLLTLALVAARAVNILAQP